MSTDSDQFFHLAPTSPAYARLEEAERYYLAGNANEALAAAQQAWRENPKEPDVFRVLAYLHMARGEYPPAEQAAQVAVQLDSANPVSYATLAQVYLTFRILPSADQTLSQAQMRFSDDAALLTLTADLRFQQRRDPAGVTLATRALALNAQDGYAQALLGTHYLRRRQYDNAAFSLSEAVKAYPQRWDYQRDLGIALLHQQQYPRATEALLNAYRLNPVDPAVMHYLYIAMQLQRRPTAVNWRLMFFFYSRTGVSTLMNVFGYLFSIAGVIWVLGLLFTTTSEAIYTSSAATLLVLGLLFTALTQPAQSLRRRKGNKFELVLARMIDGEK